MALEFVLSIKPNGENLDEEIKFIKSAILYADKINVISPSIDIYTLLSEKSKNKKNIEMDIISKLTKSIPICQFASKEDLSDQRGQLAELETVVKSGGYKNSRLIEKMRIQNILRESQEATVDDLNEIYGKENTEFINFLVKNKLIVIDHFKNSIENINDYYSEFLEKTEKAYKKSIPVLSEEIENSKKIDLKLPVFNINEEDLLSLKGEIKEELNAFKLSLNKFKKEIEKAERKNEDFDLNALYKEVLEESYKELLNTLSSKSLESLGELSLFAVDKNSINNLMPDFAKKTIISSALVGDRVNEIKEYNFKDDSSLVLYFA